MIGVTFGSMHSSDWGLVFQNWDITLPQLKTQIITPSTMNGNIDLTEFLGERFYENRTLTLTFAYVGAQSSFHTLRTNVANYLHGKVMDIIFDDDTNYYYRGRCMVDSLKTVSNESYMKLVITCNVDPYKYKATEYSNTFTVSSSKTVTVANDEMIVSPDITSSADMTLTFNQKTYAIKTGSQKMYGVRLQPGNNTLTFTGSGNITISFRGGTF